MTTFGPDTNGWQSADDSEPDFDSGDPNDDLSGSLDLGNGASIKWSRDPEVKRALLHSPQVVAAIHAQCSAMARYANTLALAQMDPRAVKRLNEQELTRPGPGGQESDEQQATIQEGSQAPYGYTIQNWSSGSTRARGRVKPVTLLGIVDGTYNNTLFEVAASFDNEGS